MDSANPNPSSSSTSNQPPSLQGQQQQQQQVNGYPSQYSTNQSRSPVPPYFPPAVGSSSTSTFHLPPPQNLAPQQQQRPLYPYPTGYGQPLPSQGSGVNGGGGGGGNQPGLPSPVQQQQLPFQHYAPYPYPFPHHQQQHPYQPYQPYGYPIPQQHYPPPNQGFSPHAPYPQFAQQPQLYRPQQVPNGPQGQQSQQRNGSNAGLPDPSASAAAAALVGLPTNSQQQQQPGGGGGGGGLDSFGLPIPPAHYSHPHARSHSLPQHALHPLQMQHHHPGHHPHLLPPSASGPPLPPPQGLPLPPPSTISSSSTLPPPSSSKPPLPSSTNPSKSSKSKSSKPAAAAPAPEVVPAVLTRERRNATRPRTSYKTHYDDSDLDSDDDDDQDDDDDDDNDGEDLNDKKRGRGRGRGTVSGGGESRGNNDHDVEGGGGDGEYEEGQEDEDDSVMVQSQRRGGGAKRGRGGGRGKKLATTTTPSRGNQNRRDDDEGDGTEFELGYLPLPPSRGGGELLQGSLAEAGGQSGGGGAGFGKGKKRARSEPEFDEGEEYESGAEDEQYYDEEDEGGENGVGTSQGGRSKTGKSARGGWGGAAGTRPDTFLTKLWKMLHGDPADVSNYLMWDKTGRLLLIPDEKEFVERVCKVHFSQKSITSFNKQMNNWDFKRHSRSQRDLQKLKKHNPSISRETRIWYHTSLHSRSTWDDVSNVTRHEDGMAKKRRVRSKRTGVEEQAAPRRGRPKGSGGPLKLPGMMSSESEGEEEEEVEPVEKLPTKGTKSRAGVKGKGKAKDEDEANEGDEEGQDQLPKPKRRKVGSMAKSSREGSPSISIEGQNALEEPNSEGPSSPNFKPRGRDGEATDIDAPGELDEDATTTSSKEKAKDGSQDAEGEVDAEGVADDDAEMAEAGGDAAKEDEESSSRPQLPVVSSGRRTRASLGLRHTDPPAPPKPTKARGPGRGKKANAGVSKAGDEITPEKKEAIEEESNQSGAGDHSQEDEGRSGPDEDKRMEAIEIVRQDAPKPKSRGGGWYLPARVAEARKKQQAEEAAEQKKQASGASEGMQRGGAGFSPEDGAAGPAASSSTSAVFALPRPPHLSNLPEVSSAPSNEPTRSASDPPEGASSPRASTSQTTPPEIHHPQDAPNPYFSDPGHERPPFEAKGSEPASRPFIHPAHAVPEELFVPGVTAPRDEAHRPITQYPVPVASEEGEREEHGRTGEPKSRRGSRGEGDSGPEDFEAQYAKLEALVAGDGNASDDGGELPRASGDEDDELYASNHRPQHNSPKQPHQQPDDRQDNLNEGEAEVEHAAEAESEQREQE